MKKIILYLLMLTIALSTSSCRKAIVEKVREKIRLEAIEKIERQGLTGITAVTRIANDTGTTLTLNQAWCDIYYADRAIGRIQLREAVSIPPHTTASVTTHWQAQISDPLTFLVVVGKVKGGDISQITVSFTVEGKGGMIPVKLNRERIPASVILDTFGYTTQDLLKYLI